MVSDSVTQKNSFGGIIFLFLVLSIPWRGALQSIVYLDLPGVGTHLILQCHLSSLPIEDSSISGSLWYPATQCKWLNVTRK